MVKSMLCFFTTIKKKVSRGTSLVAQWLRFCAPNTGGPGSIPGQELDPTCMPQIRSPPAATNTRHN